MISGQLSKRGGMTSAIDEELFDGDNGLNSASGACTCAIQRGGRAGEVQGLPQSALAQQAVDESCVKYVAGAGRVHHADLIGGPVTECAADTREDSFMTEGCSREIATESLLHLRQRFEQIGPAAQVPWNVAADDKVVNLFDQAFDIRVEFVQIGDDRDTGLARPGGGREGGCGVVTVDVQHSRIGDPLAPQFFGAQRDAIVASPQNGALAGVLHQNKGLLAGAGGRCDDADFDAGFAECLSVERGSIVVAEFADVTSSESPELAGHHSGGDLAAWQNRGRTDCNFGSGSGVFRDRNQRVSGVQTDAHNVDWHR